MWVKICGIRDVETARAVAALGADAIGLNFYARSPRRVELETAVEIVRALPAGVEPVAIFVNSRAEEILKTCEQSGIRMVQLHGDESPELVAELTALRVIRCHRVGAEGLQPVEHDFGVLRELHARPWAGLVDARVAGQYGGTGQQPPWDVIAQEWRRDVWPPLVLSGGLTPENVAHAIQQVRPWGVDTAGGVERSPGVKDLALVERFIAAARGAS